MPPNVPVLTTPSPPVLTTPHHAPAGLDVLGQLGALSKTGQIAVSLAKGNGLGALATAEGALAGASRNPAATAIAAVTSAEVSLLHQAGVLANVGLKGSGLAGLIADAGAGADTVAAAGAVVGVAGKTVPVLGGVIGAMQGVTAVQDVGVDVSAGNYHAATRDALRAGGGALAVAGTAAVLLGAGPVVLVGIGLGSAALTIGSEVL